MSQYQIARVLYEADGPLSFEEIHRAVGSMESTVRSLLPRLMSKGVVVEKQPGQVYAWNPKKDEAALEAMRSYTIDELQNK